MNPITKDFIEYFNDYLLEDLDEGWTLEDINDERGDYVCKYAESQEEVNEILDELDIYFEEINPNFLNY